MTTTNSKFIAKNGLDNNSQSLINVATPTSGTDGVNKTYVDNLTGPAATDSNLLLSSTGSGTPPEWKTLKTISGNTGTSQNTNIVKIRRMTGAFFVQTADHRIFSWGNNAWGQLGQGSPNSKDLVSEVQFPNKLNGASIVKFETISNTAYVLFSNGDLYGWGANYGGQLGTANTTEQWLAIKITSNVSEFFHPTPGQDCSRANVTTIGQGSIWVKYNTGAVYRCGNNSTGHLGIGSTADITIMNGSYQGATGGLGYLLTGWVIEKIFTGDVNMASTFMLMRSTSTGLYALMLCGENTDGQLGNGANTDLLAFVQLPSGLSQNQINGIQDIQSGGYRWDGTTATQNGYTVLWTIDSTDGLHKIFTTGANNNGQLGRNGTTATNTFGLAYTAPVGVSITKVLRCYSTVYLVLSNGNWVAWGDNSVNQIDTTGINKTVPLTTIQPAGYPCTNIWADSRFYANYNMLAYFYYPNGFSSTNLAVLGVRGYNTTSGTAGIGNVSRTATLASQYFPNINAFDNVIDNIIVTTPPASQTATALISFTNSGRLLFAGDSNDYESNTTLTTAKYGFNTLQLGNILGQ